MFLQQTDNAPEVREMFKAQLEQREQIKVKQEIKPKYTTGDWSEANFDLNKTVEDLLIENNLDFKKVDNLDINSSEVIRELSELDSSVILYSGFGGVLLREPL